MPVRKLPCDERLKREYCDKENKQNLNQSCSSLQQNPKPTLTTINPPSSSDCQSDTSTRQNEEVKESISPLIQKAFHHQVFGARIRRAVDWIASRCNGGKFGSSQGTVLALKAIVTYDVMMASERAPGTVHLLVDGERVESKAFDKTTEGAIAFGDISARLAADGRKRRVEVEMEGGADMPYAMQVSA